MPEAQPFELFLEAMADLQPAELVPVASVEQGLVSRAESVEPVEVQAPLVELSPGSMQDLHPGMAMPECLQS